MLLIPLVLAKRARSIEAFFGIPFITCYLLHYTVATIGVLSVVILGPVGVLNATAIAALLGGLFGYVLGAASRPHDAPTATVGPGATPSLPAQQDFGTKSALGDADPS